MHPITASPMCVPQQAVRGGGGSGEPRADQRVGINQVAPLLGLLGVLGAAAGYFIPTIAGINAHELYIHT